MTYQLSRNIRRWWQEYVLGRLRTPQDLYSAAHYEVPDPARLEDRFLDGAPPDGGWTAPERLKAPAFMRTNGFLKQWDRADWQYVDPRLMYWASLFIEYARKRGIPLYVHTAFRTHAEQDRLKRNGRSRATYPRAPHCIGEAVDIVHGVYHWEMSEQEWKLLHMLGLRALERVNAQLSEANKLRLTWGGSWRFYDPAHWEITDWRARVRRLSAGPPVRRTPRRILRSVTLSRL